MAFLPADRQRQSGIPKATLIENLSMTSGRQFVRYGRLSHGLERAAVERLLNQFDVRPAHPERMLTDVSGGKSAEGLAW